MGVQLPCLTFTSLWRLAVTSIILQMQKKIQRSQVTSSSPIQARIEVRCPPRVGYIFLSSENQQSYSAELGFNLTAICTIILLCYNENVTGRRTRPFLQIKVV